MAEPYSAFEHLLFDHDEHGVVVITINRPEKYNATNFRLHQELADVWDTIQADPEARGAVITGAG
ncbi:MAG: enoyl-CoA hydratase-related protein, partial [Actinomycetota bacterium]|nr:enoyl-CoA hydratase-related protein [Actinomycetota bacterium]